MGKTCSYYFMSMGTHILLPEGQLNYKTFQNVWSSNHLLTTIKETNNSFEFQRKFYPTPRIRDRSSTSYSSSGTKKTGLIVLAVLWCKPLSCHLCIGPTPLVTQPGSLRTEGTKDEVKQTRWAEIRPKGLSARNWANKILLDHHQDQYISKAYQLVMSGQFLSEKFSFLQCWMSYIV